MERLRTIRRKAADALDFVMVDHYALATAGMVALIGAAVVFKL